MLFSPLRKQKIQICMSLYLCSSNCRLYHNGCYFSIRKRTPPGVLILPNLYETLVSNPFLKVNTMLSLSVTVTRSTNPHHIPASNSSATFPVFSRVRMNPLMSSLRVTRQIIFLSYRNSAAD